MYLDILLGVVTVAMAVLGGIVSAHAPTNKKHKWRYGIAFVILGIVSVALIVYQSVRSDKAQAELHDQIKRLEDSQKATTDSISETSKGIKIIEGRIDDVKQIGTSGVSQPVPRSLLHILKFELLPLSVGKPIYLNIIFENRGVLPAEMTSYSMAGARPNDGDVSKELEFAKELTKRLPSVISQGGSVPHTVLSTGQMFMTDQGPAIPSDEELAKVHDGKYLLYFVGSILYKDAKGRHETHYCIYTAGNPNVIMICPQHNEEL